MNRNRKIQFHKKTMGGDVESQPTKDDGTDAVGSNVDGAEEAGTSKDEL
jgi:hypothetical protein